MKNFFATIGAVLIVVLAALFVDSANSGTVIRAYDTTGVPGDVYPYATVDSSGNWHFYSSGTFTNSVTTSNLTVTATATLNNTTNLGTLGVGGNIYGSGSLSVATMSWNASPTNGNGIVMVGTSGGSATLQSTNLADAIQKATSGQFGTVKVDGTTITASGGVISSVGGSSSKDGSGFTNVLFQAYAGCNDSVAGLGIPVYMPINGYTTVRSASASSATNYASPAPFNMVLTNFSGFIDVPQGTGTNEQMIVMTNGIASALTFTITGNGTIQSGSDNTHGVYITAGTLVALQSNPNNGLSALAIITWSLGAFKAP